MLSTLTNFRALALTLALCVGASFLGAFVAAWGTGDARPYPSNRVERRQVAINRADRSELPLPVKALSAPDTPINVLAANLDAAERAESPPMAPRNPVLTGSRRHLERRLAKLE